MPSGCSDTGFLSDVNRVLGLGEEGIQPTKKRRLPRVSMSGSVEPRNKRGVCEIWMLSSVIVERKRVYSASHKKGIADLATISPCSCPHILPQGRRGIHSPFSVGPRNRNRLRVAYPVIPDPFLSGVAQLYPTAKTLSCAPTFYRPGCMLLIILTTPVSCLVGWVGSSHILPYVLAATSL